MHSHEGNLTSLQVVATSDRQDSGPIPSTPEPAPAPRADLPAASDHGLGITLSGDGADFAVHAPHATAVDLYLLVMDADGAVVGETRIGMHGPSRGLWSAHVPDVDAGQRYGYRAHGPWDPHKGLLYNPRKLLLDPYAQTLDGRMDLRPAIYVREVTDDLVPAAGPWRSSRLDSAGNTAVDVVTGDTFPVVLGLRVPRECAVVYEAHVRGLTYQLLGVLEGLRDTYAGSAHSATVEHLKALGITTIELLPVHTSVSEPFLTKRGLSNYWGYFMLSYLAPEPFYATAAARTASPQAVLDEVHDMVSMLHEVGLEVVLNVVYNHTRGRGVDDPSLGLRGLDNLDYYLYTPHLPAQYMDVTGTGNTVDFRAAGAVRLVLDSLRYWATEVGVDGFRFDLATTLRHRAAEFSPHYPLLTTIATDLVLSTVKLISEPWDMGPGGWRTGQFPEPFRDQNDHLRDITRSFWLYDASEISKGRLGLDLRDLATRLSGSADLFSHEEFPGGRGPLGSVSLVATHDSFTLYNLVVYGHKHNLANKEDNRDSNSNNRSQNHSFEGDVVEGINGSPIEVLCRRSMRNLLATALLSAGTPMLVASDEMGHTQQGNDNCYCQDSVLFWADWNLEVWQCDLVTMTRFLIRQRHNHPMVRLSRFATGQVLNDGTVADLTWYRADTTPMDGDS